jgi:hypothetical protein
MARFVAQRQFRLPLQVEEEEVVFIVLARPAHVAQGCDNAPGSAASALGALFSFLFDALRHLDPSRGIQKTPPRQPLARMLTLGQSAVNETKVLFSPPDVSTFLLLQCAWI